MYYFIIDYEKHAHNLHFCEPRFSFLKKLKLYEKYKQYQQYKQFIPNTAHIRYEENDFFLITLPSGLKDLKKFSADKIQQSIRNIVYAALDTYYLFDAAPELLPFLPPELPFCEPESREEVYIKYCKVYIAQMLKSISQKNAHILFLDDGTYAANTCIRELSKNWNFVSVISNRHDQLEDFYRYLYEEEGLMVQCISDEEKSVVDADIVIDLTGDWKGIHRKYPKGAYVYDFTFSHEKADYLRAKQVKLRGYVQAFDFFWKCVNEGENMYFSNKTAKNIDKNV